MTLVLSLNSGSSSCKVQLFEMPSERIVCSGLFERIGLKDGLLKISFGDQQIKRNQDFKNHHQAIDEFFKILLEEKIISEMNQVKAVGHRIVHGGEKYAQSVIMDDQVAQDVDEYSNLAPLHNPANLLGYTVIKEILPEVLQVAVFDTAFHQTLSKETFMYPIPMKYYENYKIRKYGFHGTSHLFVSQKAREVLPKEETDKIISCHLGNGASISAIKNGTCINTSMGFTPLAGIMMGTRSGDIDPAILPFIQNHENLTADEALEIFNRESGLLGISQLSSDMRDIKEAVDKNDQNAILALNMYIQRIGSTIGSYIAQLGGCDCIIFTAGVGENAAFVRERVLNYLKEAFHVVVDVNKNNQRGDFFEITTEDSSIKAVVISTNEELMIAKDTYHFYLN
jgi:acetate kinase